MIYAVTISEVYRNSMMDQLAQLLEALRGPAPEVGLGHGRLRH
ncbi:hypothetical protein [Moorena bouillonii]|nr:hypothetical protein [Moorena bouillonii]